ncbi:hypothetical protein QFZ43_000169 [Streptomyces afghaniensis]|nr:hypothetical protein [Streptomyces afghaniensis]
MGLVIVVTVLAANTHDNAAGVALLKQVAENTGGTVRKALVDQGFKNQVAVHGTRLGIDVETVERNPQDKQGLRPAAEAVESRADLREPDTSPAPGSRLRAPPGLLRLPRPLGDDPRHGPPPHRHERPHLARPADGDRVNIQPLLDALGIQEAATRAMVEDLHTQIDELQARLRKAETQLDTSPAPARPSPPSPTGSMARPTRPTCPTCPSTRTTPASSPSSTRPPGPSEPATCAKPASPESNNRQPCPALTQKRKPARESF